MSREIKFRCWNAFSNHMHDWAEMVEKNKIHLLSNENKSYTCEQFTGLKDKNGVEIYEGDITKHGNGRLREVKWIGGMFDFQSSGVVCDCENGFDPEEDCEVVGNIHQTQDLIK